MTSLNHQTKTTTRQRPRSSSRDRAHLGHHGIPVREVSVWSKVNMPPREGASASLSTIVDQDISLHQVLVMREDKAFFSDIPKVALDPVELVTPSRVVLPGAVERINTSCRSVSVRYDSIALGIGRINREDTRHFIQPPLVRTSLLIAQALAQYLRQSRPTHCPYR